MLWASTSCKFKWRHHGIIEFTPYILHLTYFEVHNLTNASNAEHCIRITSVLAAWGARLQRTRTGWAFLLIGASVLGPILSTAIR